LGHHHPVLPPVRPLPPWTKGPPGYHPQAPCSSACPPRRRVRPPGAGVCRRVMPAAIRCGSHGFSPAAPLSADLRWRSHRPSTHHPARHRPRCRVRWRQSRASLKAGGLALSAEVANLHVRRWLDEVANQAPPASCPRCGWPKNAR
jgi:hypothetical protein